MLVPYFKGKSFTLEAYVEGKRRPFQQFEKYPDKLFLLACEGDRLCLRTTGVQPGRVVEVAVDRTDVLLSTPPVQAGRVLVTNGSPVSIMTFMFGYLPASQGVIPQKLEIIGSPGEFGDRDFMRSTRGAELVSLICGTFRSLEAEYLVVME